MRRCGIVVAALFALGTHAHAQRAIEAVPFYQPAELMQGLARSFVLPRAEAFEDEANALVRSTTAWCDASREGSAKTLTAARDQWTRTVGAWERLSTVPLGPLIERRSIRSIDFVPPRPASIERAIAMAPADAAAMERIGGPAKGFPALEWLLWTRPGVPGSPACRYAGDVARDIAREAAALQAAFRAWADRFGDEAFTVLAWAEFVNQWIGAAERLRLRDLERPIREARETRKAPAYPRAASGTSAQSWQRRWDTLRTLARLPASEPPPLPGAGLVPLDVALLARGHGARARRWQERIDRTGVAMQGLQPAQRTRIEAAARELALTRRMAEESLAPALDVRIGFSDADGD